MIVAASYGQCMFFAATPGVGHGPETGPITAMRFMRLLARSGTRWPDEVNRSD
jgi:hypothetical protein